LQSAHIGLPHVSQSVMFWWLQVWSGMTEEGRMRRSNAAIS
jgi:hypothetical protein